MCGWIKIHRQIKDNWIWNNPEYLKAWLTILFTVNYEPKKVPILGELLICERGQSLLSLEKWVDELGPKWSIQRLRTFFKLLKSDGMITVEGLSKTTRLTVCNYDTYQDLQQTNNIHSTNIQQTNNIQSTTTKEGKERIKKDKEVKEETPKTWRTDFGIYLFQMMDCFEGLRKDFDFIKLHEKYNPDLDIILTIEKSIDVYWKHELKGWKKKKQSKTLDIDWKDTFVNALSISSNRVWKKKTNKPINKTSSGQTILSH